MKDKYYYIVLNAYFNVNEEELHKYLVESYHRHDMELGFVSLFFDNLVGCIAPLIEEIDYWYWEEYNRLQMELDEKPLKTEYSWKFESERLNNLHRDDFHIKDPWFNKLYFTKLKYINDTIEEVRESLLNIGK